MSKKSFIYTLSKNKFKFLIVIMLCFLLFIFLFPMYLNLISQPDKEHSSYPYQDDFITDYDAIRERFLGHVDAFSSQWKQVKTFSQPIDLADNLYTDSILLEAEETKDNLIVITTGVHGIEGYIGATMLEVFIDNFLPNLDQSNTGVLMITNVNPYGVKHQRRYNENNVDLNRNFIFDWNTFNLNTNTDYPKVQSFLQPPSPIENMTLHEISFLGGILKQVTTNGVSTLSNALLGGQYNAPKGVYYGGTGDEKSTAYIKEVFEKTLNSGYKNIIHLDLHSGYGPRYNMTIFNSQYEKMTEEEAKAAFNYDTVIAANSKGFYPTNGDTTEYFYKLLEKQNLSVQLYSTCFEFGTLGDDFLGSIQSMKYTIDENRNYWFPTSSKLTQKILNQRYMEMFFPSEPFWREKAVTDFLNATTGVLNNKLIK